MKKTKIIFFKILLLIGVSVLFYPNISQYINTITQSRAVVKHSIAIEEYDEAELEKILSDANEYNKKISQENNPIANPDKIDGYNEILNPLNNGMMGYISIEKINLNLPIYHGMSEGVIQENVGHLQGSSLPVGGESTHSVISTHSGLPSARLFTDLNKLEIGDYFNITVLNKKLIYKIDQIVTVLPNEINELQIEDGKDYVTMFTCTPYGINTHRLLVRGKRIQSDDNVEEDKIQENLEKSINSTILKMIVIIFIIVVILISIIRSFVILFKNKYKNKS